MPERRLAKRKHVFWFYYYKLFRSSRRFVLDGKEFPYFYHRYNRTWRNERVIEVPLALHFLKGVSPAGILEVGNVLSHYLRVTHDIVDKYEVAEGVVNQDIVDLRRPRRYDRIVTISTLEHVGWDEDPKDPQKILRAMEVLKNCLAPGGRILATIPIGYNPHMDRLLGEHALPFDSVRFLKRISADNEWKQVLWKEVEGTRYNRPYPAANALAVAETGN